MSKKKILTLVLALALVATCAIGGTVAYLIDTKTATNTFTIGNIDIELTGTTIAASGTKFVPGQPITANTQVSVKAGSEACYLFIKVTEENNTVSDVKIIDYTLKTDGWTAVNGVTGYYYRVVVKPTSDSSFDVFSQVTVNANLTKGNVDSISTNPSIVIKAAAIQKDYVGELHEAFNKLPESFRGTDNATKSN